MSNDSNTVVLVRLTSEQVAWIELGLKDLADIHKKDPNPEIQALATENRLLGETIWSLVQKPTTLKSELVKLFQEYIDDAESQLESDNFLPGLDVTQEAAVALFNDVLTYHIAAGNVQDDTSEHVTA